MKQRLYIEYDVVTADISIIENDMTVFESFGVIEAAKAMISNKWLNDTEGSEING